MRNPVLIFTSLFQFVWQHLKAPRHKGPASTYQTLKTKDGFKLPTLFVSRQELLDLLENSEVKMREEHVEKMLNHFIHEVCHAQLSSEQLLWTQNCIEQLHRRQPPANELSKRLMEGLENLRTQCWLHLWKPQGRGPQPQDLYLPQPDPVMSKLLRRGWQILQVAQKLGHLEYIAYNKPLLRFISWIPECWNEPDIAPILEDTRDPVIQTAAAEMGSPDKFEDYLKQVIQSHPLMAARLVQNNHQQVQQINPETIVQGLSSGCPQLRQALLRATRQYTS